MHDGKACSAKVNNGTPCSIVAYMSRVGKATLEDTASGGAHEHQTG